MLIQFALVAGLVLVHIFAGKLRLLEGIPRSSWLSFAGGLSVSYVFLHLFPEMKEAQERISEEGVLNLFAEQNAYFIALIGLILFYGLERLVRSNQARESGEPQQEGGKTTTTMGVFWLHIASFAFYNALIGYLLVQRDEQNLREALVFFVAMALHFTVNDYGLRQDHKGTYKHVGRWILSGAILVGWLTGLITTISDTAVHALFAFLAGGVILNVLKEELPEDRQSRFLPFVAGAILYAMLLLL